MGGDGLNEKLQHRSALFAEASGHRKHPLHKSRSFGTVRPETALAPEHRGPDFLLSGVVGRLHSRDAGEDPEASPVLQKLLAGPGDRRVSSSPTQDLAKSFLDRAQVLAQRSPGDLASLEAVPEAHGVSLALQSPLPDLPLLAREILNGLEVSLQMCPAQLMKPFDPLHVGPPTIRGENPIETSGKGLERGGVAAPVDSEHREHRRHHHPEPRFLSPFPPARLVEVRPRSLLSGLVGFGVDRLQRRGGLAFEVRDRSQRKLRLRPEEFHQRPFHLAPAQAEAAAENRRDGLESRPNRKARRVRGHVRQVPRPTLPARAPVALVLGHLSRHGRHIYDLMSQPQPHLHLHGRRELPAAPAALAGIELDEVVDLVGRKGFPVRGGMTPLPARLASRVGRRFGYRRGSRWVRTGGFRGVRRVLAQAVFQLANPGLQLPILLKDRMIQLLQGLELRLQRRYSLAARRVDVRFPLPSLHFAYSTPPTLKSTRASALFVVNAYDEFIGKIGNFCAKRLS